ncbi:MAG TPA: hypothetical protein VK547_17310 [Candidatus Udaeobacter sp.]|nr:hypothetical protein [Candidatus Udaeobacter sp.]
MMRSLLYVLLTLSALGVANATVSAAELTGSTEAQSSDVTAAQSSDAKMPAGADFSNGPAGGGAQLIGTDHVPTGGEFSNGPDGGATVDQTPRRMPSGAEFSNGPTGITKE